MTGGEAAEEDLVAAARDGDHDAFAQLVGAYQAGLHAHCYRMLGSAADADDALQDTLLRAWRGLPRFAGRGTLRGWLYTIATNACLRLAERRPRRALPDDYGPASEPGDHPGTPPSRLQWIEPYPEHSGPADDAATIPEARYDQRESVELAFVAALQHLTPAQRAALILHDVLGFAAAEIAVMIKATPAAVYSALQRAHKTMQDKLPGQSQQAALSGLGDAGIKDLAVQYADAWHSGDVEAIVAMLTQDVIISMPPLPHWFCGSAAVGTFLATWLRPGQVRLIPARANGQLAFGHYRLDDASRLYLPHSLDVVAVQGAKIATITGFLSPGTFASFGLAEVAASPVNPGGIQP